MTKGMVGAIEHLLSPDDLVATFKSLDVVANRVNIEVVKIMLDGILQGGCVGKEAGWSAVCSDSSNEVREDAADVGHDQLQIGRFIEQPALDEAESVQAGVVRKTEGKKLTGIFEARAIERNGRVQVNRDSEHPNMF